MLVVADALGAPIDGQGPISTKQPRRVELKAPSTIPRQSMHERQTGKTAIVFDTILNQRSANPSPETNNHLHCVYVSMGQKRSAVAQFCDFLRKNE